MIDWAQSMKAPSLRHSYFDDWAVASANHCGCTSWPGIASVSVLFNWKADGAVDGARPRTVDSDADVCEGQFGSTDDATDPHPYGDNASFSGNASVSVLFSLRDDGVVDGAWRGTVESDAVVCDGHVVSKDDAADLRPGGDNATFNGNGYVSGLFTVVGDANIYADVGGCHVSSMNDATLLHVGEGQFSVESGECEAVLCVEHRSRMAVAYSSQRGHGKDHVCSLLASSDVCVADDIAGPTFSGHNGIHHVATDGQVHMGAAVV